MVVSCRQVLYLLVRSLALEAHAAQARAGLLFALECALGVLAVLLVGTISHWFGWLLPVDLLLYLMIVLPTALLCGFWQALIVSLSAVVFHGLFTREAELKFAEDPANTVTLLVFVLVALVVSRLSARVTGMRAKRSRGAARCTTSTSSRAARCR